MDAAEPMPMPVPDDQAKDRPFAEPNAKPKVTDLPVASSDLAPTAKPETQTKPDALPIDTTKLPQPNTESPPKEAGFLLSKSHQFD